MRHYHPSRLQSLLRTAILLLLVFAFPTLAQEGAGEVVLEIPPGAEAGPDFDVATATEAYINILSEEQRQNSEDYANGEHSLHPGCCMDSVRQRTVS